MSMLLFQKVGGHLAHTEYHFEMCASTSKHKYLKYEIFYISYILHFLNLCHFYAVFCFFFPIKIHGKKEEKH